MRLLSRPAIIFIACLIAIPLLAGPAQAQDDEPFITLSPSSGIPGTDVTVRGYNFDEDEEVEVYYYPNGSRVRVATEDTDDDGDFRVSFEVPESYKGEHEVRAYVDNDYERDEFIVEPGLTVDPEDGPVGTTVTVKGMGFEEDEEDIEVRYYINGDDITVEEDITADENGSWDVSFKIPPSSSGSHKLDAKGDDSSFSEVEDATFEVMPGISIDKSSGSVGDTLTVKGSGFQEEERRIRILFDSTVVADDIRADEEGAWEETFTLPEMPKGEYDVTAEGDETDKDDIRAASFEVKAGLVLSPITGHVGTELTVSGSGFAADKEVIIKYDETQKATGTTDGLGSFSNVSFVAPESIHGEHQVTAEDALGTEVTAIFTMESQPPPKPALILPSNGSRVGLVGSVTPTFEWSEVTDDSGVTYSLQVATSRNVTTAIVSVTGLTEGSYTLPDTEALSQGTYYWRVQAVDGARNDSGWTVVYSFKAGLLPMWGFIAGIALIVVIIGVAVYFLFIKRRRVYY
jgi:hypothetical protein